MERAGEQTHFLRTDQKLVQSNVYDTYNNRSLDHNLRTLANARTISSDYGKKLKTYPGGLPDTVLLSQGISVIVTPNVETELDMANSGRG